MTAQFRANLTTRGVVLGMLAAPLFVSVLIGTWIASGKFSVLTFSVAVFLAAIVGSTFGYSA
ncbi:hypothetical protein LJR078_001883 [Arthrobacter sp. LjRoot78]|uniref:hypothetical protein n=1 Tax=Arthrobacter sp. LjRoot78 TaxID=3342338 RepID=UPI003ED150CF